MSSGVGGGNFFVWASVAFAPWSSRAQRSGSGSELSSSSANLFLFEVTVTFSFFRFRSNPMAEAQHFNRHSLAVLKLSDHRVPRFTMKRSRTSAGLLMFEKGAGIEVLLAHPGGPYFRKKDEDFGQFLKAR
jgi:hypothetical protein